MSWQNSHVFCYFFPRTNISTGTSWTEPRCCVNSCKITGNNFGNSLYVPICCRCAFLLSYYLNLWKLCFSFNNTDRVPGAVTGKENLKKGEMKVSKADISLQTAWDHSSMTCEVTHSPHWDVHSACSWGWYWKLSVNHCDVSVREEEDSAGYPPFNTRYMVFGVMGQ